MGGDEEAIVMPARVRMAGRAVLPRTAFSAVISLAAGLGILMPAPQAALAATLGASSISAGDGYACALDSGQAYCWGFNGFGQLGDGSITEGGGSTVPVAVSTAGVLAGKTLAQISAGGNDTCALDSAGAAYCWGLNEDGELGDGSLTAPSDVPVAVDTSGVLAGKTLTQISVGLADACALDRTGAVYCWGLSDVGELGDGSTAGSDVPVAVDTSGVLAGKTITQISVGSVVACAVDSAGRAYCWGANIDGDLGDGRTADSDVPVAVDTSGVLAGKTITQISTNGGDTCALDSAGAAYCWGYNVFGELGNGTTQPESSPVPVAVDSGGVLRGKTLTEVSAGDRSECALDSAGAAYCWGYNASGNLGDGSTDPSSVPVAVDTTGVLAGKTLTELSGGACAVDSAGAVYCWGENGSGELGDGSTAAMSEVPVLAGPQAPTRVTATPGDTKAIVSWTPPVSLDGGTLTGYTATAAPGTAACTTTGATSCTLTGLTDGTTYRITVEADTTAGDSGASSPVTVTPTTPTVGQPAFTSPPAATGAYGARLAVTISAAGNPPPRITHTGPLPPGLRFAEEAGGQAAITGIPARTAAGPYHLTLTATNVAGKAVQAFTITITRPPALVATTAATATTGKAFRLAIKVTGYPAPALAETGRLPRGLAFTSKTITGTTKDAVIAGTPAAGTAGTYPLTITATSSSGKATARLTLTVTPRSRP
jgi:alpha-tubulin suppressor-like RCC1 family protein